MSKIRGHLWVSILLVVFTGSIAGCGGEDADLLAPELTINSLQLQNANTTGTASLKVSSGDLNLSGAVEQGAVVEVEVNAAEPVLADLGSGAWSYTLPNSALAEGVNTIVVSAEDAPGNKRSLSFFVTKDTLAPSVTIDQFVTVERSGSQIIGGTVEVGAEVEILVDGVHDGFATVSGGLWSYPLTGLAEGGPYRIGASASDALGNTSAEPATQDILVDLTAPLVVVDEVESTTATAVTVTGSRDPGSAPVFSAVDTGATVSNENLSDPAVWSVDFQNLESGPNVLSVTVGTSEARVIVHRDLSGPVVIANAPAHGAEDVPATTVLSVTFSEDLDESLVTDSTTPRITLSDAEGGSISGAVTYDALTRMVTFTPDAPLSVGTTYTATVLLSVADTLGNLLGANYSWKFTTAD